MGRRIVVNGSFTIEWDVAELREDWGEGEADMTEEELLAECLLSVERDWDSYATTANTVNIDGDLVG